MPTSEFPSLLVNCANAFARETRSWLLIRILRDHEARFGLDHRPLEDGGRAESMRIDIFYLGQPSGPSLDYVWWCGWVAIALQIGVALVPNILYRDWGILMVVLAGNLLSAITCALPQWSQEKWAGRKLEVDKITCLTRGNGNAHIMVFIGSKGSWDLKNLSTATARTRPETRWISIILAILWTCFLINVSGLKVHAWFLVASGTLGMLQYVLAAGTSRRPSASNFPLTEFSRASTIIGKRQSYAKGDDATVDLQKDLENLADIASSASKEPAPPLAISLDTSSTPSEEIPMPQWLSSMSRDDGVPEWLEPIKPNQDDGVIYAVDVHGALMELEKWVPTAGLAMVHTFFPGGLKYRDEQIRDNVWKRAYHTSCVRKVAEEKRRREERDSQTKQDHMEMQGRKPSFHYRV